ncbi:MAG: transferase [Proteobacteria bacterium]|nr:transferase [Pseudomonadota bacterium]NIS72661.1 transferase [Pseudomonadota bacterium]
MKKVVILGAGGHAREVLWVFEEQNKAEPRWEVLGFIDENTLNKGRDLCNLPILGDFGWFDKTASREVYVISGVGNCRTKLHFAEKAANLGLKFCSVVHPSVMMSSHVTVGAGTVIAAGSIITTQVKIANHVTVNLDCTISHDAVIEDYCTLAPGCHISGNVKFGEGVNFGTCATIIQGKSVGAWSKIGAGAVVIEDIPANVAAVGVPARIVREA